MPLSTDNDSHDEVAQERNARRRSRRTNTHEQEQELEQAEDEADRPTSGRESNVCFISFIFASIYLCCFVIYGLTHYAVVLGESTQDRLSEGGYTHLSSSGTRAHC